MASLCHRLVRRTEHNEQCAFDCDCANFIFPHYFPGRATLLGKTQTCLEMAPVVRLGADLGSVPDQLFDHPESKNWLSSFLERAIAAGFSL